MSKNIIDLDDLQLAKIKQLAIKNDLPKNKQDLVNLALKVAINSIDLLDDESFEQINNLVK